MSLVRILESDGTVVVLGGEKKVPEPFGWLWLITDSDGFSFLEVVQSIRLSHNA